MEDNKNRFEAEQSVQSEAEKLAEEIVSAASAEAAAETEEAAASATEALAEETVAEALWPNVDGNDETTADDGKKPPMWLWIVIGVMVAAVAVVLVLLLPKWQGSNEDGLTSTIETTTVPTTTPTTEPIVRVENPKNFAELQEECDDIIAWVEVPNTNVNYPVVQSSADEEEDFYLHRDLDKNYDFAGTIYIQKLNNKDFTDPHTVLYGHAMLNGTMFKTLHEFKDEDFFNENPTFTIYIPGHILTYQIFAAYQYDDRHLLYAFNTKDKDEFAKYLEIAQHPTASLQNTRDVTLTADSRIVTLSTCLKANAPIRYLVQGVLIEDQLTY